MNNGKYEWKCPDCSGFEWEYVGDGGDLIGMIEYRNEDKLYMMEVWKCIYCGKILKVHLDVVKVVSLGEDVELYNQED